MALKITRQVIHCKQWHHCTVFQSYYIALGISTFYKVSYEQGATDWFFFLLVSMENRTDQLGSKKKPVVWLRHATRQNYGAW